MSFLAIQKLTLMAAKVAVQAIKTMTNPPSEAVIVHHHLCGEVTEGSGFGLNSGDTFFGHLSYENTNLTPGNFDHVFLGDSIGFFTPLLHLSLALGDRTLIETNDFQFCQLPLALFDHDGTFCGVDFVVDDSQTLLVLRDGCYPNSVTGIDKLAGSYFEATVSYRSMVSTVIPFTQPNEQCQHFHAA